MDDLDLALTAFSDFLATFNDRDLISDDPRLTKAQAMRVLAQAEATRDMVTIERHPLSR